MKDCCRTTDQKTSKAGRIWNWLMAIILALILIGAFFQLIFK